MHKPYQEGEKAEYTDHLDCSHLVLLLKGVYTPGRVGRCPEEGEEEERFR
jgi:hypothetical protein